MVNNTGRGGWLIALSFMVALFLTAVPLPMEMRWTRPDWVALVLIYWVLALPQRVGIVLGFTVGLCVDLLEGAMLGQHAFSLSVVAYLTLVLYQRLRQFNMVQQVVIVFAMVGINQLVAQWIQNLTGVGAVSPLFLVPALLSALFWPATLILLRRLRRYYAVE
ncbi:MAG: rod shape-determining protein MreD [Pseudomonadota bacterium]